MTVTLETGRRASLIRSLAQGLAAIVLALPVYAQAVQHPDNCDFSCTDDCELDQDITCWYEGGINLAAGKSLDLKGHRITCNNPTPGEEGICGAKAVGMVGTNSTVRDTGYPKGGIFGAFKIAVDCGSGGNNRVTGITVNGVDGTATLKCNQVDENVLISRTRLDYAGDPGVDIRGVTATVRNNYIGNFAFSIAGNGTKVATIDGNVIEPQSPLGGSGFSFSTAIAVAVDTNTSTTSSLTNNTILGPAGQVRVNAVTIVANNHCDESSADCQACITNPTHPACVGPAVPYLLDRTFTFQATGNGDLSQFNVYSPSGVTGASKWVLINDFPDGDITGAFRSSVSNGSANSVKTQLFHVDLIESIAADDEFQSCVIEAHMTGLNAPTYLVAKLGGTQSDGALINVNAGVPTLYTRVMTTRPGGGQWTGSDLLDGTLQIGVKNDIGATGGATVGDIQMRCK